MAYRFQKAAIIGGSFAGLWTARVLSDFFEEVVILERDSLPESPKTRPGVPQDLQVHILLERGAEIMSALFPNIGEELTAAGANYIDLTEKMHVYSRGIWLDRFESGHCTYACSRLLLEDIVRRRVKALPNVTFQEQTRVLNLIHHDGQVQGVNVSRKGTEANTHVFADFVVDASGYGSKTTHWLTGLGYSSVDETVIDSQTGYASRRFHLSPHQNIDWHMMMIPTEPGYHERGGFVYHEENGRWIATLNGMMGDYPPTDEAGFDAFAKDVGPEFYQFVTEAQPISAIRGFRGMANVWRHFEKMPAWPDRLIVVGDAVCRLNPIYGQGMSVSAMAAEALLRQFEKWDSTLDDFAWSFQRRYPKIIDVPWLLASSSDQEWLGNIENQSVIERVAGWYFPKLLEALPHERAIAEAFVEIQNLKRSPAILFSPQMMWYALKHQLQSGQPQA
ncbi:MAG: FAD-dependent monooxygenase [Chloroflexota bacterium]